jgi:hypothetical protein
MTPKLKQDNGRSDLAAMGKKYTESTQIDTTALINSAHEANNWGCGCSMPMPAECAPMRGLTISKELLT